MNKIQSLVAICALLCGATASAQFTTGGKSNSASTSSIQEAASYDQFGISYTNVKYTQSDDDMGDDISTNGISLKYLHGFSVSNKLPIYVEAGLNLNFNFASIAIDNDYYKDIAEFSNKYQFAALAIPVNVAYRFNINETITIKPYLGLNFKINLLGRGKRDVKVLDDDYEDYFDEDYEWASFYSKDDMGDKDAVWNRFQMGWHIGADVQFNKFFIGLNYGTDFIPAWKHKKYKVNSGTFNIGLGFYF